MGTPVAAFIAGCSHTHHHWPINAVLLIVILVAFVLATQATALVICHVLNQFASSSALNIVPFVQLSGPVIPENGSFNNYPEGSTLYMTAMKYRVEQEFSVDEFEEQAYGVVQYEWEDLQNKSFVPWEITVPSQTIAYLWAYIDSDNDGLVNEPGEAIAVVAGGDDGRYPTGDESQSDIQMLLTSDIDGE